MLDPYDLGADELLSRGISRDEVELELVRRACDKVGVSSARRAVRVPGRPRRPPARGTASSSSSTPRRSSTKRRVKTEAEIEGIRRAQRAADEAMAVGARMIHELRGGVTSEEVREAMQAVCDEHGCDLPDDAIVSHGPQSAIGHEAGHGPIGDGEVVIVDIWPRDRAVALLGRHDAHVHRPAAPSRPTRSREYWQLTRESLERAFAEVRAGADCQQIYGISCEPYENAGPPDAAQQAGRAVKLDEGYYHSLGHGVGLEVHERPNLGRTPDTLLAGDVITLEPGCYTQGRSAASASRTSSSCIEDGAELLTDFPYDL